MTQTIRVVGQLLLVDDDREKTQDLQDLLEESFGFEVTYVSSGREALCQVEQAPHRFEVALIDQFLDPEMDGIELMRQIYRRAPLLPTILLTGWDVELDDLRTAESGAYLFRPLQKGVDQPQMIGHYCLMAANDRTRRWQALFQEISRALHSLDSQQMPGNVLATCVSGLERMGYTSGAIYRHYIGWVPGAPIAEDFYRPLERSYLGRERIIGHSDNAEQARFVDYLDLSNHPDLYTTLITTDTIAVRPFADTEDQILIPLRSQNEARLSRIDDNLLGVIVLRHRAAQAIEIREETNLTMLGQQVGLALQNALIFRQLNYRRATLDEILTTSRRILALETGAEARRYILQQFAKAIADSLRFRRVMILVVDKTEQLLLPLGMEGLDPEDVVEMSRTTIRRDAFESLHLPEYRFRSSFFIPEGCCSFTHYQGPLLSTPVVATRPWLWHSDDLLRTKIVDSHGGIVGYISTDERRDRSRPGENLFLALEVFANQIAVALQRIEIEEEAIHEKFVKVNQVGLELIGENVSPQRIEKLILSRACTLLDADFAVILRTEEEGRVGDHQRLSYSNHYQKPHIRVPNGKLKQLILPLRTRPDQPSSLSVEVARMRKPRRWMNVRDQADYVEIVPGMNSQLSVPLLVTNTRAGGKERLVGVLTLESQRPDAFTKWHEDALVNLGAYAAQAYRRAQDQEERNSLVVSLTDDLSSRIIRHSEWNDWRLLKDTFDSVARQWDSLQREIDDILTQASRTVSISDGHLAQCGPVCLNDVVRRFYHNHQILYNHPRIRLDPPDLFLPDAHAVVANELGLRESLKILVDNAFEVLKREVGDGRTRYGTIRISTDAVGDAAVLQVFNSGPRLRPATLRLLTQPDEQPLVEDQGLVVLRRLTQLYNAELAVTQDDEDGVEVAIRFPPGGGWPFAEADAGQPLTWGNQGASFAILLHRLRRSVAAHSALLLAQFVDDRRPTLIQALEDIGNRLHELRRTSGIDRSQQPPNLSQSEPLPILALVAKFAEEFNRRAAATNDIPVSMIACTPEVFAWANPIGLRHVLKNLAENAQEAIRENLERGQGRRQGARPPNITITVRADETSVTIVVQNTGSVIPRVLMKRLLDSPIPKADKHRGRGLWYSKLLISSYGGTIKPGCDTKKRVVRFSLQLRRVDEGGR